MNLIKTKIKWMQFWDNVNIPLIVCDAVCIFLSLVLVCLKLKYDKEDVVM